MYLILVAIWGKKLLILKAWTYRTFADIAALLIFSILKAGFVTDLLCIFFMITIPSNQPDNKWTIKTY